jgi:hypothetical protein
MPPFGAAVSLPGAENNKRDPRLNRDPRSRKRPNHPDAAGKDPFVQHISIGNKALVIFKKNDAISIKPH